MIIGVSYIAVIVYSFHLLETIFALCLEQNFGGFIRCE